ncbi:SAM-dependent methyltransferase [Telmatospirillum sp. J64-1]|uniref:SAM-dependent methyltransferase n=1 Tax=Telmatospirillum sp. J64-1 TaxID=2502183 RepID=UPI0021024A60|nr:SAM-dependent methyltransferase [Telmatospirillum sp. J64-1]
MSADEDAAASRPLDATVYLAAEGFEAELIAELGEVRETRGRLVVADGPPRPAAWAQNVWLNPQLIPIASIKQGAKALRAIQRNWALYSFQLHRRAQLLQEQLPPIKPRPVVFPSDPPSAPLGSWTLWDENTILAASRCSSPWPHGEIHFAEDKQTPPNRAYLKLWEALTLTQLLGGRRPAPGDRCLDLGACPGGWTWVLHELGAEVISVDKAPLDPRIDALPRVTFRQDSAFALEPAAVGPIDWLCCDVICYPQRLLRMVERWLAAGTVRNFVCTLKFQGETDHETARAFAAIPGSHLVHLFHNKHELTWILLR